MKRRSVTEEFTMAQVITYQSPRGLTIAICQQHIAKLKEDDRWPRDWTGQEYATVSHGLHQGTCDYCDTEEPGHDHV